MTGPFNALLLALDGLQPPSDQHNDFAQKVEIYAKHHRLRPLRGEGENVRSLTSDRDSYCRVTISLPTASQFSELIPTSVCCPGQYSFRQNVNTINLQRAANKLFGSRKYFGRSFEQAQFVSKLRRSLPVIRFTKDVFFDK